MREQSFYDLWNRRYKPNERQQEILDQLNVLLSEELTAINQYILHGEMCGDWGYGKLHDIIEKRAIQEMKHAEKLIERILFLEVVRSFLNWTRSQLVTRFETIWERSLASRKPLICTINP